ncbi:MAG: hypothetical protein N2327_00065 [Caldimicrobium sp.]|nr:hypothetical protein [Caldimicrobium sp.]MCX7872822.1 hypothetical protein [Caldimicrobium sp.]MDW8093599.1 hypothetical protein [Caldimicrobium sp.]
MKEKINLSTKIKERVLSQNISLNSLRRLPIHIYNNISNYLHNFILLYESKIYKPNLKIIDDRNIFLAKNQDLPNFKLQELVLLILPFEERRYVFICKITQIEENGYTITLQDPRTEERFNIKQKVPVFLSLLSESYINEILQTPDYTLLRECNASEENYSSLSEIHLYDLVLNANHNIDEKFKKYIQKTLLVGELRNISRGGLAVKVTNFPVLQDKFNVFYVKFNLISTKLIKFALFCHLRWLSQEKDEIFLHFTFITSIKESLWNLLREDLNQ